MSIEVAKAISFDGNNGIGIAIANEIGINSTGTIIQNGMYPMPGSGVDQQFFVEYADTVKKINALKNVENQLGLTQQQIENNQNEINQLERKLSKARKDQPKLEKRIHRNENPRFLHYIQFNRKEKVEKLKGNLANMISCQEKWTGKKDEEEKLLEKYQAEFHGLKNAKSTKDNLSQKRLSMYDQTIASVPPTPRLLQIETSIQQQGQQITLESGLLQRIENVLHTIQQVQQLYGQSLQMLQQAENSNTTAQVLNFTDRYDGPDVWETMEQAQRDQLINQSQIPANEAYSVMQSAWTQFPMEAKQRYPSLAMQIGKAPLPRLRGANFGNTLATGMVFGGIGDAINNGYASSKIAENMRIISECSMIVQQQYQLVEALRNAIVANITQMESQMTKLNHQRDQERDLIFTIVQKTVCPSSS